LSALYVYAAALEAGALAQREDTLALGIGKTAATLTLTRRLAEADQPLPSAVILFGVAGAHAGGPEVGTVVVVDRDVLLDEGVQTPTGYTGLADLGLPMQTDARADAVLSAKVAAGLGVPCVSGSTVSTCSGVEALAASRAAAGGGQIETMEGAAVGIVCQHFGVPWTAVRAISNRTGDRDAAGWDLDAATAAVQAAVIRVMEGMDV